MTAVAPEYVLARSVLIDALHALGTQRNAVILVGAQAIYLHTGDADLAAAPMTTDADLTIDVERVAAVPDLATAMRAGGFEPGDQPGSWKGRSGVLVDVKDALDVLRLLRGVDLETFASGFGCHAGDAYAWPVAERAPAFLRVAGQSEEARLARLVAAASGGDRTIPACLVVLAHQLLGAVG